MILNKKIFYRVGSLNDKNRHEALMAIFKDKGILARGRPSLSALPALSTAGQR